MLKQLSDPTTSPSTMTSLFKDHLRPFISSACRDGWLVTCGALSSFSPLAVASGRRDAARTRAATTAGSQQRALQQEGGDDDWEVSLVLAAGEVYATAAPAALQPGADVRAMDVLRSYVVVIRIRRLCGSASWIANQLVIADLLLMLSPELALHTCGSCMCCTLVQKLLLRDAACECEQCFEHSGGAAWYTTTLTLDSPAGSHRAWGVAWIR